MNWQPPVHRAYDVVIVGGAMMGSAAAWWLSTMAGFDGRILVVERDPGYGQAATSHTNSCIRQQFSAPLNVRISRFGAEFVQDLPRFMGPDARLPRLKIRNFGYLYLAATPEGAVTLRENQAMQSRLGAATRLLTPQQILAKYPFYMVDDLVLGAHNPVDEGYFDGTAVFDWFRRKARENGVEYLQNEVTGLTCGGGRVETVTLASGEAIACGHLVNAAGTRGAALARMAGIEIPVEPRKRHTWVIRAETPLPGDLPLTVDPSGVHMRQDGRDTYMIGGHGASDPAVDPNDFDRDPDLWMDHIWPRIARRIPAFETVRVIREWVGHYDMNLLDQNAITGPHPQIGNFHFLNGFSGHGLQQAPAMGRGMAEWITHGGYRSLDLSPFHYDRIVAGRPFVERAII